MTPYRERREAGVYAPKPEKPKVAAPKRAAAKRGKAKRDG